MDEFIDATKFMNSLENREDVQKEFGQRYKTWKQLKEQREKALDELTELSQDLGLYSDQEGSQ